MDIFVFISVIISLLTTTLTAYLLCKHKKIRTLIASLGYISSQDMGAISGSSGGTNFECTTLAYIGITLTILSLIIVMFLHYRKTEFCKGHRFSNTVKLSGIMVLILFEMILSKVSLLQNKYYFLSMTSFPCLQVSLSLREINIYSVTEKP